MLCSVAGSLMLATFPGAAGRGKAMLAFLFLFGTLLVAFALNPLLPLAPLLLLGGLVWLALKAFSPATRAA